MSRSEPVALIRIWRLLLIAILLTACSSRTLRLDAAPSQPVALAGDWVLDPTRSEVADGWAPGGEFRERMGRRGQRPESAGLRGGGAGPGDRAGGRRRGPPPEGQARTGGGMLQALRAAERLTIQVDGEALELRTDDRPPRRLTLGRSAGSEELMTVNAGWEGSTLVVQQRRQGPRGREGTVTERYALSPVDGSLRLSTEIAGSKRARVLQRVYVRAPVAGQ